MKRSTRMCLVVLVAALFLAGCAFNRNAIIGSWSEPTSQQTWQFTPGGKMILSTSTGMSAEVGYQFWNDTTIVIPLMQDYFSFTVEGNTLTLKGQSQTLTLTRVP